AVLTVLAGQEPGSQQQAAQRLGVDRTTMVALIDALEDKGLVRRHADAEDRRRDGGGLTEAGRDNPVPARPAAPGGERRVRGAPGNSGPPCSPSSRPAADPAHSRGQARSSTGRISLRAASVRLPDSDG